MIKRVKFGCLLSFLALLLLSCNSQAAAISPIEYGLLSAQDGKERYNILYKTHVEALARGVEVDYSGLSRIDLVIPEKAKSIPVVGRAGFCGVEFHVTNNTGNIYLFTMIEESSDIVVEKGQIEKNEVLDQLDCGDALLSISDANLWVKNRNGYNYGVTRKDLIIVKNGKLRNNPIASYNNDNSIPKCKVYPLKKQKKHFGDIKLIRREESTYKTFLLKVEGQYNLELSDIVIFTPENDLNEDSAIRILDCAKVRVKNVTIDGTYSQVNKYGYGIVMNNVYDVKFLNLNAYGAWGVFGTNNTHNVTLNNCDINRFDVHCYGKDITCKNCIFRNLYNQFSSMYGTVKFNKCVFDKAVPVVIEYSFNAYTGFDLVFEKCKYNVSDKYGCNCIVSVGFLDDVENERPELKQKCWPNVSIKGMTIKAPDQIKEIYLMRLRKPVTSVGSLGYATDFILQNISFEGDGSPKIVITNHEVLLPNKIRVTQRETKRFPITIQDNITRQ